MPYSRLALPLVLLSLLAPAAAAPPEPVVVVDRVVAVVNNTIILYSELKQRVRPMMADLEKIEDTRERGRQLRVLERQVLDEMIEEELVLQAAAEAKLEVTDQEVDKAMDEVKRQNKLDDAQLAEALSMQGYTVPEYRKDVRRQILRLRAINVLVRPNVSITDDDVRERYEKLLGKSSAVTEVHVQHILVKLPEKPTADDIAGGRRRAGELVARARGGEDFAVLAKAHSDDDATKAHGGDLGWFKRGELPTEWEEILFAMTDGEVRGPINGPKGLEVFRLAETRKEAMRPLAEIKEQLRSQMFNEELDKQTKLWLEQLRKKAHVDVKL